MLYRLAADAAVVVHFSFVVFALFGALLVLRWRRVIWFHLPAGGWALWIELSGGICPLTPLENRLRRLGGEQGYAGGFIEQYMIPILYPEGLTRGIQIAIGLTALVLNLAIYAVVIRRWLRS